MTNKTVPVEPTEEMLSKGAARIRDFLSESGSYPRTRAMYKAMIEAAPEQDGGLDDNDLRWLRGLVSGDHQDNLLSHGRANRILFAIQAGQASLKAELLALADELETQADLCVEGGINYEHLAYHDSANRIRELAGGE